MKHAPFYLSDYSQTYNERGLAQSKLWPPGTLCITIAANIADTAILTIPACFPDSILGFQPKAEMADVRYVKYCLDGFRGHMEQISKGTTQDNLSLDKLLKLRFWFPDIDRQKKIAAILSAYDDLIANNQRRIAVLESMAEKIYREWFVRLRFPGRPINAGDSLEPESWERKPLGQLMSLLKRGVSPDYNDKAQALVINQKCIRGGRLSLEEARLHSTPVPDEKMLRYGDVLVNSTGVGTLGRAAVFDIDRNDMACDSHVTIARPIDVNVEGEFLAYTVQLLQPYFEAMASGSTGQAELGRDFISKTKVLVPPRELMVAFSKHAQPIRRQRRLLLDEIERLAATRDALLPRLISGKLRVDQLNIQAPPSMRADTAPAV